MAALPCSCTMRCSNKHAKHRNISSDNKVFLGFFFVTQYKLWGLIHTQLHEPAQMRLKFMACTTNIHWLVPFLRAIKRISHLVPICSILDVFFIYLTICFRSDEVCTVNNKVLLVIIYVALSICVHFFSHSRVFYSTLIRLNACVFICLYIYEP